MTRRRAWLLALGSTLALLILAGMVIRFLWVPHAVRARIEERARALGLVITFESLELGSESIRLHGVHVRTARSPALVARAAEVTITIEGLLSAARKGSEAIEAIDARGGTLRAATHDPAFARLARRLRGRGRGGGRRRSTGLRAELDRLEIDDAHGALIRAREVRAERRGRIKLRSGPIEIGGGQERAHAASVEVELARGEERLQLVRARIGATELRYRSGASEDDGLRARLRGLLTQAGGGAEEGRDREAGEPPVAFDRILERVHPRAQIVLVDLRVIAHDGGGPRTVLRHFRSELRGTGRGTYLARGTGTPGSSGRLGWDLRVSPRALRAEGHLRLESVPLALFTPFLPELPWHQPERGRLSGALELRGAGVDGAHAEGRLEVEGLALSHPRIAPEPVEDIRFWIEGVAEWRPQERRLSLTRGRFGMGQAEVGLEGALEWPADHYLVDLRADMPSTGCMTAVEAIPEGLLGELRGFGLSGRIGGEIRAHVDSRQLEETRLRIDIQDSCRFESAPPAADITQFSAPFVHRVVEPDESIFEMETGPGSDTWTPIQEISPFLVQAVIGHEDGGFAEHHGFSRRAIRDALIANLRAGRYVQGASTITMQLVKNIFLRREKTLARKVQEVLLTWWVESVMSKAQILELYLNVIEYGPSVYGVRNAAMHYFGCTPAQLSAAQAAYLASILPNPKLYHVHYEEGRVPAPWQRRVERFVRRLQSHQRFDAEATEDAVSELRALRFGSATAPVCREAHGHATPLGFLESHAEDPYDDGFEEGWDEVAIDQEER